jgi:hypothetical protein
MWGVENRLPAKIRRVQKVSDRLGPELNLNCVQTDHTSTYVPHLCLASSFQMEIHWLTGHL